MYTLSLKQKKDNQITVFDLKLPQTWYEVNTRQYVQVENMKDKTDTVEFISILASVPKDVIGEVVSDKVINKLQTLVANILGEPINWKKIIKDVPKTVLVKGKELKVKPYGKFTLAQRILFEELLLDQQPKKDEDLINMIPEVCAIAFFPEYYGKPIQRDELPEFQKIIDKQPIVRMIAPAYFFLIILMTLTVNGTISSNLQLAQIVIKDLLRNRVKQKGGKSLPILG